MACIYKSGTDKCTKGWHWDYCGFDDTSQCVGYKPSNADRIRSLSDEELAKLIAGDWCELMPCECDHFCDGNCEKWILKWLKEEAKDGE